MNANALQQTVSVILGNIWPLVLPICMLIVFINILLIGFELIFHRKDEDKRKETLTSLIYVAIGTLIVLCSLVITKFILDASTGVAENIQQQQLTEME